MKIRHILVPVDLDEGSPYAARYGLSLAHKYGADLTLLHVAAWQGVSLVAVEPMYMPQGLVTRLEAERLEIVGNKLDELKANLVAQGEPAGNVHIAIERGFPHDGIMNYADEHDIDLIVMESRGSLGSGSYLLGGTADKVSRHATRPVLIAPPSATDAPANLEHALVTIDYSVFSLPNAQLAAQLVGPGGSIELIHVWQPPFIPAVDSSLTGTASELQAVVDQQRTAQIDALSALAAELDTPGVEVSCYVGEGSPTHEILTRAKETQPDLIVLGAHSRERLSERIRGTVADRVLRHANTSVLMVPSPAMERRLA